MGTLYLTKEAKIYNGEKTLSLTNGVETGDEKQTLSIGFLGHVFTTFDRDDVKEKLDEAIGGGL